jgi:hypothetical protein
LIASAARHAHKLLFPTYDGVDDPLPWLNRCDQFFRIQNTQDSGKVFLVSFYMTGNAAQWYVMVAHQSGLILSSLSTEFIYAVLALDSEGFAWWGESIYVWSCCFLLGYMESSKQSLL